MCKAYGQQCLSAVKSRIIQKPKTTIRLLSRLYSKPNHSLLTKSNPLMKKINTFLLLFCSVMVAQAQLNVSYVGSLEYNNTLNDIWGYVAPDGTEYALVGVGNGTSVVSLADPANPVEIGFAPGDQSVWRDIKTWGHYAFVTCDQGNDGLTVIDLSDVPNSISYSQVNTLPNGTLNTCHNIWIDEFGYAYLAGCNLNGGGMVIMDCFTTPGTPTFVANAPNTYSHDVYTRNNLMYSSEINDGVFTIYDVADKSNITELGSQQTPSAFTHNSWLSDDSNILFTTDEVANAPIGAYDVSDPSDIQFLDSYAPFATLGSGVIPHNVHVWQNWLIISYYTDGCIILDATHPDNLVEVGNFDTYIPASTGFNGAWGAYPFLPSGLILITDIGNGLYILEPNYVQAGYLHGNVTDAVSGTSIPNAEARVLTTPTFALTDASGLFKTGMATAGTYTIEVSKPGYETASTTAVLVNGEITTINVQLNPLPSFAFSGTVVEAGSNNPIAGAQVNIKNDFFNFNVTTDASGNFNLSTVFEDSYDIYAGKWGYKTSGLSDEAISENNNSLTIELETGYEDVFAVDLGWTISGNGGFFGALWERGNPIGLVAGPGILLTPEDDVDDLGPDCYVTGNSADVPGTFLLQGNTVLTSPAFDLTGYNEPMISYHYWYLNAADGNPPIPGTQPLVARLSNGTETSIIAQHTMEDLFSLSWHFSTELKIDSFLTPTDNMTFSFTATSPNQQFIAEAAMDYWRVWDANPSPPVGVQNPIDQSILMAVYPNPSSTDFQLNYDLQRWNGQADLVIQNTLGQVVGTQVLNDAKGIVTFGKNLPRGIYFALIKEANRSSKVLKLVKE
jgi:choice-of-anchor B domain-containing protein